MKKRILVLGLFACLISLAFSKSYGEKESNETPETEEVVISRDCKIPPPWDRNCNGIPDENELTELIKLLEDILYFPS